MALEIVVWDFADVQATVSVALHRRSMSSVHSSERRAGSRVVETRVGVEQARAKRTLGLPSAGPHLDPLSREVRAHYPTLPAPPLAQEAKDKTIDSR
jgi:hypothetical protein